MTGSAGPVRVYRQTSRGVSESERGRPVLSGRRIPWRAVLATAAAAFLIAVATITVIDLVSGGSVGKGSGGTTFFRGGSSGSSQEKDTSQPQDKGQQQQTAPDQQQTAPDQQQTAPEAQPPPSDTAPTTAPTQTAPADPLQNATP